MDSVLDPGIISQLLALGDSFVAELAGLFEEDAKARMAEAHEAADQGDMVRLKKLAHTMKGAGANMAAQEFSELCRLVELEADKNSDGVKPLLHRLDASLDRTMLALGQYR